MRSRASCRSSSACRTRSSASCSAAPPWGRCCPCPCCSPASPSCSTPASASGATPPGMTPLEAEIRGRIALDGPMSVADYMALCLGHPVHGYYQAREPFGRGGDFVTAPEISQMFGELLGLWAAETWRRMGAPDPVRLVELGPGRGTLMRDALRAARAAPDFAAGADLHL